MIEVEHHTLHFTTVVKVSSWTVRILFASWRWELRVLTPGTADGVSKEARSDREEANREIQPSSIRSIQMCRPELEEAKGY